MHRSTPRGWQLSTCAILALVPVLSCFACGSDELVESGRDPEGFPVVEGTFEPTCDGYSARLRACGVLTAGEFSCNEPTNEAARCELGCLTGASCAILWDFQCRSLPPVLDRCLSLCNAFTCASAERIPLDWQCDGAVDCLDGESDELGCETFDCGDGEVLPVRYVCDGDQHCSSGADEHACPTFVCGSGEQIAPWYQCDLDVDCEDASDEAGCQTFTCADTGQDIPPDWQCDQMHDCLDGSDEAGCAEVLCR